MRLLLITSRFPWPPYTGDRLRATIWIEELGRDCEVTLIAPRGTVPPGTPPLRHVALRSSCVALAVASPRALAGALPFQSLLAAGFDWPAALREAGEGFDAAVAFVARATPWLAGRLPARRTILDAIDATSVNSAERARATRGVARLFWEADARRMARVEREAGERFDRTLVVSAAEREPFGPRALVVPNGVEIGAEASGGRREFDFAFWGNLSYFANHDALAILIARIWPLIRGLRPDATLLIAGANAPKHVAGLDGREGITVVSPAGDRSALLRRVSVALLPLRAGSGVSNKVLEGAEASCALAGTPLAFRGLTDLATGQVVEEEPAQLARLCAELASDPPRIAACGATARNRVVTAHDRHATGRRLRQIIGREGSADYNPAHE